MAKRFPRITKIIDLGGIPARLRWECNFCAGREDPKDAWLHVCAGLCECGHVPHTPGRCYGKQKYDKYTSYAGPCQCNTRSVLDFQI